MSTGSTSTSNASATKFVDVVVVGAGLGGLATAARLAAAGRRVVVCERARHPGGRGRTRTREGFALNFGAHALYARGPAMAMLRELGVEPRGRAPSGQGVVLREGSVHTLPATPRTTLTTSALELRSKFGLVRLLGRVPRLDLERLGQLSCAEWLEREIATPDLREFVAAVIRLATYCASLELLSADAALGQLREALAGVLYLDGGWAQLVDALVARGRESGVELRLGAKVEALRRADTARWAVQLERSMIFCDEVVLAGSPAMVDALLPPSPARASFVANTHPCRAAVLDLGLRGEWPGPGFLIDLDEPIYLSVHSEVAELAPPGHTLVSLLWYRRGDEDHTAAELRGRLEALARRWMPDFEEQLVVDQFLPDITVAHDMPHPSRGGLAGRSPVSLGEGLHLVGDWVGDRAMLLDASLASASAACRAILGADEAPEISARAGVA
jgi:phytoene dehydrogenase-like protein